MAFLTTYKMYPKMYPSRMTLYIEKWKSKCYACNTIHLDLTFIHVKFILNRQHKIGQQPGKMSLERKWE